MNSGDLCMASSMECGTLTMDEQEPLLGLLGEGEGDGGDDLQTWTCTKTSGDLHEEVRAGVVWDYRLRRNSIKL